MVKNIAFQALFKAQRFHPVSAAALNTRPHIPPLKGTSQKKTPQEQKHQKYRPLLQRKVWTLYNVTSSKPSVHRVHTSIFISNHINMIRKTIYIKKKNKLYLSGKATILHITLSNELSISCTATLPVHQQHPRAIRSFQNLWFFHILVKSAKTQLHMLTCFFWVTQSFPI